MIYNGTTTYNLSSWLPLRLLGRRHVKIGHRDEYFIRTDTLFRPENSSPSTFEAQTGNCRHRPPYIGNILNNWKSDNLFKINIFTETKLHSPKQIRSHTQLLKTYDQIIFLFLFNTRATQTVLSLRLFC